MFELKVVSKFSAAHQLQMVGEKCENLHGHNWKVEVYVTGQKLDEGGVLIDFGVLKKHVRDIMETLDHKFVNDLPMFHADNPPSSENMAVYIATEVEKRLNLPGVRVSRVSTWETENSCATYIPEPKY